MIVQPLKAEKLVVRKIAVAGTRSHVKKKVVERIQKVLKTEHPVGHLKVILR